MPLKMPANAAQTLTTPEVHAAAYILIEADSGRVLTAHNEHNRMFPAATTMILTAILAYEHIGMNEIITIGDEVDELPFGSARIGHRAGEEITGEDMIRAMIVGTGLDTANTVALTTARRVSGDEFLPFSQAQIDFTTLMTERAAQLGAMDTRFVNPHGFHHGNHYSTAYDLARIARHAMSIPTIAAIANETRFRGRDSANELLHLYPYAIGIRTGFTNLAGETLVAAAYRDGVMLIAVTLDSPLTDEGEPTRWQDAINLFEYGFANYAYRTLLVPDTVMGRLNIDNPRLGAADYLEFYNTLSREYFLSAAELSRLETTIEFLPEFIIYHEIYNEGYYETQRHFQAPIEQGEKIGTINHILDGEILFITNLYAANEILLRTTASDIDFYMDRIVQIFFSRASIPYWIAALSVLALLIVAYILLRNRYRAHRAKQGKYKMKL
jgi:D-alanyl-D-alanine carboxypeptidase (penicillin-binding protein 5/6)